MVSEIFPLRTRGRGISMAVLTNFASNAVVTFAFSPLKVLASLLTVLFSYSSLLYQFLTFLIAVGVYNLP
jgi:hypothetical protein